jgi:predicted enzyme related to lactoylglutathione lyase
VDVRRDDAADDLPHVRAVDKASTPTGGTRAEDDARMAAHAEALFDALTGTGTRGFTCTVAVDDLDSVRHRVTANGGTITYEEIEIPTVGTLTEFLDTEGNEVAAMVYEMEMYGA